MLKKALFMAVATLLLSTSATAGIFEVDDHAVAWKVRKWAFFVPLRPKGINREAKVSVKKTDAKKNQWQVEVTMPSSTFKSGIGMRDRDVAKRLGDKEHTEIRFVSEPMDAAWFQSLSTEAVELKGELTILGNSSPVSFQVTSNKDDKGQKITGVSTASIKGLGVKSLSLFAVRTVRDKVELHFQFFANKIEGSKDLLGTR